MLRFKDDSGFFIADLQKKKEDLNTMLNGFVVQLNQKLWFTGFLMGRMN